MNFIISFGICSTPKLLKKVTLLPVRYKAMQCVPIDLYSSRFITYTPSVIFGKLFLE